MADEDIPGPSGYQPNEESNSEDIQGDDPNMTHTQNRLREFALHKYLEQLTSRKNCISVFRKLKLVRFSAISEYEKLVIYVSNYPEPGKSQLACLLFPTFVHLYILLLQISRDPGKELAQKFYTTYACIFYKAEGYESVLKELQSLGDIKGVINHHYFKNFREQKCVFGLSVDVFKDLVSFIDKLNSSALLYVFHLHFHFEDDSILNRDLPDDCLADSKNEEEEKEVSEEYSEEMTDNDSSTDSSDSPKEETPEITDKQAVVSEVSHDEASQSETVSLLCEELENVKIDMAIYQIRLRCNDENTPYPLDLDINTVQLYATLNKKELHCIKLKDDPNFISKFYSSKEIDVNMEEHSEIYKFDEKVSVVKCLPHTLDELLLAVGETVVHYSLAVNKEIFTYKPAHDADILDIDVNSCASYFVTVSADTTACIFDLKSKKAIRKYIGHLNKINTVRFHPTEKYFVTGSSDCTVRLWTVEKDLTLRCFVGHTAEIFSVACANNGKILASADTRCVVKLWDLETSRVLHKLFCSRSGIEEFGRVTSLCFNDNNTSLIACNVKGIVTMWNVKEPANQNFIPLPDLPLMIKYDAKNKIWVLIVKENTKKSKKMKMSV